MEQASFRIDVPVDHDFLQEPCTPEDVAFNKRLRLKATRTPKSPEELRKIDEKSTMLRALHLETVQARASRESLRATEAKTRRERAEWSARERAQDRLDSVAERVALKDEEKRRVTSDKARLREARADDARQAREARTTARTERLALASNRVAESSRRAADILQVNAAKNARLVERAAAVAAITKKQHQLLEDAASKEKREEKKIALPRSMAAATEPRQAALGPWVGISSIGHVSTAHKVFTSQRGAESKAEQCVARKIHFATLHDAAVLIKMARETPELGDSLTLATHATEDASPLALADLAATPASTLTFAPPTDKPAAPVAFEIPRTAGHRTRLPASVEKRLQVKSRTTPIKSGIDLQTRKALSSAARARFAKEDVAIARAVVQLQALRAQAFGRALAQAEAAGAARARSHMRARRAVAANMNNRVQIATIRRSAAQAEITKQAATQSLWRQIASGRRAARLLSISLNDDGAGRTELAAARRGVRETAAQVRGHSLRLRELSASIKRAAILRAKAALARMSACPLRVPPSGIASSLAGVGVPQLDMGAIKAHGSSFRSELVPRSPPDQHVQFASLSPRHHSMYPGFDALFSPSVCAASPSPPAVAAIFPSAAAPIFPPAVAFEIPVCPTAPSQLPEAVTARLERKTSAPRRATLFSLQTRLVLAANSRIAFALVDLAMIRATREQQAHRAKTLAAAVADRTARGSRLALFYKSARVNAARAMNGRVHAAAIRRSAIAAAKAKSLRKLALREKSAAGRRASILLTASSNADGARRAAMVRVHRDVLEAAAEARAQACRLRHLHAEVNYCRGLMRKSEAARLCGMLYADRTPLCVRDPAEALSFGLVGRSPAPRRPSTAVPRPVHPILVPSTYVPSIFAPGRTAPLPLSSVFPDGPPASRPSAAAPCRIAPKRHESPPPEPPAPSFELSELDTRIAMQNALHRLGVGSLCDFTPPASRPPLCGRSEAGETIISESSVLSDEEMQDLLALAATHVQAAEAAHRRRSEAAKDHNKDQPRASRRVRARYAAPIVLCAM